MIDELTIGQVGILQIRKFPFLREGVVLQPLQQFHIHPKAAVSELGSMDMKIGHTGDDQLIPKIPNGP